MLLGVLFCSLLLLFWVGFPLLRARQDGGLSAGDEMTRERIDALLRALRDLYKRYPDESQRDGDFANIENGLMLKLAGIYHAAGIDPGADVAAAEPPAASKKAAAVAEEQANSGFCHKCGKAREPHFKFCPGCGADIRSAA